MPFNDIHCPWGLGDAPDSRQDSFEIAAENSFDLPVAVLAANQSFSQVIHTSRVIEPFDVDLLAEAITALVPRSQSFVLFGWHLVIAIEIDVAADSEVLRSDQFSDVIEMIERVFYCGWLVVFHEHSHAGNSHDAAGRADLPDRFIGFAARVAGRQGAAIGVRDQHRLFGKLERVQRGAVAAVRYVDRHADFIHPLDDGRAKIRDALITTLGGAVADEVARVISQLRNTLPQPAKEIHVGGRAKLIRILKAQNDPDPSGTLHAVEITG